MAPGITRVLTSFFILAISFSLQTTEAAPKWRPAAISNRRSSGSALSGCWTPRGRMELGQRVYPGGCSRIVCKIILGQPIIEHQFCEKINAPKHCIMQERPWKRYPDCCPEVVCPPAQQNYYGSYDTRFYQQEAAIPNYYHSPSIQEGFAEGNEGSFHRVASQQHQKPSNNNRFFATPQPLRMATDVVYGKGVSGPYLETTSVRANTDQQLVLIDDNRYPTDFWDPKELHYLVSPTNVLDLWNNDYQEDVAAHDGWNTDFEPGEPYKYREFQDTTTTDPAQATPFVISYVDSEVDDSTKSSYSFYNDPNEVKTSPLPYREQIFTASAVTGHQNVTRTRRPGRIRSKGKQTAQLVSTTETTEAPPVRPTTYSPHTNLRNRYKPTFPVRQASTQSSLPLSNNPSITKITSVSIDELTTTPTTRTPKTTKKEPTTSSKKDLFLASVKDSKDSSHQYEEQPTLQEDNSNDSESPSKLFSRLPPVRKTTQAPFERITKRVRSSGAPKKRFRIRKTTTAPITTTAPPSSYEFVPPELDPQEHDLVEFIHTPLDPSALIPGHGGYLQSKSDSAREYSEKGSGNGDERRRRRRSVPADAKHEDEEKDEKRTKPTFYIPWRNALENTLSIDAKTLTESQSAENSHPPTKFEQAANILKGLMSHPSLLAGVLTSKKNVLPPTEPLGNKTVESGNFTLNDERKNQSNNGNTEQDTQVTEQDTQSTVTLKNNTEEDPYDSLTTSEGKPPPENEENSNTDQPIESSPENNNLGMGNLTITNEGNSGAQSMVSNNTSDSQVVVITSDTVHSSNKPTENDPEKVTVSSGIEKDSPAQEDRLATNSSSIARATLSSAAKSDSIPLHNKENQTSELAALVDNGNSHNFNPQFTNENASTNIQRIRVPVYKRGPNREQNSTTKGTIFGTNNSEIDNEGNPQNKRRLPWSPRPSRENQNNGFSSEAVRTRIQVPFLNYERRSKDPTTSPSTEQQIITDDSKESSFTARAQYSEHAEAPTDNQGEGSTREQSHSRVDVKERKNEYYPRKRTVKDSNIPHLRMADDSDFSRSMDRSLQLEPTRNFYSVSQTYSDWSGDTQNVTGRELSGYPHDIYPKPEPRYRYGPISRFEDNHSLPPLSATIGKVPHSFLQSFPSGQGRSFMARDPKPITSSVTFSNPHVDSILSQYSKSFEDNSDESNHDFFSETNSESLFSSSGNPPFSSSFGTEHGHSLFNISNHDSGLNNYFKSEHNSGTTNKASAGSTETSTVSNPDHTSSKQAFESDVNIFELGQTISSLSVPPYPAPTAVQSKPHSATTAFSVNPENVPLTLPRSNGGVKHLSAASLQGSIYDEAKPSISSQPEVTSAPPNNTFFNSSPSKAQDPPKPINNFRARLQTLRTQSRSPQNQQSLSLNHQLDSSETKNDSRHNNGLPRFSHILSGQPVNQNLTKDSVNGTAKENVENVESNTNSQSSADNSAPQPEQGGQQTQRRLRNRGFPNQAVRQRMNRQRNSQSRNVPVTSPTAPEPTENRRRNSYQTPKTALGATALTSNQQRRVSSRQGTRSQSHPLSDHQPTSTHQSQDPRVSQKLTASESTSIANQPARTHQNRRFPQQTTNKSNPNEASSYRSRGTRINTNPVSPPWPPVPAPATTSPLITKATAPTPTTVPPLRENFSEENINFNPDDASLLYSDFWEPKKNAS